MSGSHEDIQNCVKKEFIGKRKKITSKLSVKTNESKIKSYNFFSFSIFHRSFLSRDKIRILGLTDSNQGCGSGLRLHEFGSDTKTDPDTALKKPD